MNKTMNIFKAILSLTFLIGSIAAAKGVPQTKEIADLESDLRAEGFTPLTAEEWKAYDYYWDLQAAAKTAEEIKEFKYSEKIWGKVCAQMEAGLDGTPQSIKKYIATLYCTYGSTIESLSGEDAMTYRWMKYETLVGAIALQEFSYDKEVPPSEIKRLSLARMRLAARLLRRFSESCDLTYNYTHGGLLSIGEDQIGHGFRNKIPGNLDSDEKLVEYFRYRNVTSEMLTQEELKEEEQRIKMAKKRHLESLRFWQKKRVGIAEGALFIAMQHIADNPGDIKKILLLAGYDTKKKQRALFERQKKHQYIDESILEIMLKNFGFDDLI